MPIGPVDRQDLGVAADEVAELDALFQRADLLPKLALREQWLEEELTKVRRYISMLRGETATDPDFACGGKRTRIASTTTHAVAIERILRLEPDGLSFRSLHEALSHYKPGVSEATVRSTIWRMKDRVDVMRGPYGHRVLRLTSMRPAAH
jgi:hypothetical protein